MCFLSLKGGTCQRLFVPIGIKTHPRVGTPRPVDLRQHLAIIPTSQHLDANPKSLQNHLKSPVPAAALPWLAPNLPSHTLARGMGFAHRSLT